MDILELIEDTVEVDAKIENIDEDKLNDMLTDILG